MFSRRLLRLLVTYALLALLAACGKPEVKPVAPPKTIADRFTITVGDHPVRLQLAVLPAEMMQGLMFRRTLAEDEGMIFVYPIPQPMSFHMRNTEIPLDIGFFDAAGELKEIYPMYPHDERPVVSRGRMQVALEMNQGWYRRQGVKTGAKIDLKALGEAIRARGMKVEPYGWR